MMEWRLHRLMGERRLKIADVARMTGLLWETVAGIYHGKPTMVSLDTLDALCKGLNCGLEDILAYVPDQKA